MTYYNTTNLRRLELAEAKGRTVRQEDKVLAFFQDHPGELWAVHQVNDLVLPRAPHHSAQRAITNLTDDGHLEKTKNYITGKYGKRVHTWRLMPPKREQIDLF